MWNKKKISISVIEFLSMKIMVLEILGNVDESNGVIWSQREKVRHVYTYRILVLFAIVLKKRKKILVSRISLNCD